MVIAIRTMCRMFDDLFHLIRKREMKSFNFPNISVSGLEQVSMVCIEVSNTKNSSMSAKTHGKKQDTQRRGKVDRIRRGIATAKNGSNCRKIYFNPENMSVGRLKIHVLQ